MPIDKLIVERCGLDGVLLIQSRDAFEDHRGVYRETYNEELYRIAGIDVRFVEDDVAVSTKHVLRGIHGNRSTWKLVSCLHGKFYLVVVNNVEGSPQYRRWQSFVLSDRNCFQVLIPPGFGNGHLVLSDVAIFSYKQSDYYQGMDKQFTLFWDDPALDIWWPVKDPILSIRDSGG